MGFVHCKQVKVSNTRRDKSVCRVASELSFYDIVRPKLDRLIPKFDSQKHNVTGPVYLITGDCVRSIADKLEDICTATAP